MTAGSAPSIVSPVVQEPEPEKQGVQAREDAAPDGESAQELLDADARMGLDADERDDAADERDAEARQRDRTAHARDVHAEVRDAAVSDQPDITGSRRFAAQDRDAAAKDRDAASYERLHSRVDRKASGWDRSVSSRMKAKLIEALEEADRFADATLVIGQAQGMLMVTSGGNASEAMMDIGHRADRDQVGLQEAARRILAEGAASGISSISVL